MASREQVNTAEGSTLITQEGVAGPTASRELTTVQMSSKMMNDPIHGYMEFHPLLVKIIDTPQLQRLRNIKQLGACYFVYPGASHNRFEHSLGVCHLAGLLAERLGSRQPELGITKEDVLCVQIAGLCHDLGHGPLSHVFDDMFMPVKRPDMQEDDYKHELLAVKMFEHMITANNLREEFDRYLGPEGTTEHIQFIREQIRGKGPTSGRDGAKLFLYEIVTNKTNDIDVNKWDYFVRDCHHLGFDTSFEYKRFMNFARVLEIDGRSMICYRDKEAGTLYDMFNTWKILYRRAYQHKTKSLIEEMIVEALVKADDFIKISGTDGRRLKMSESVNDMAAYGKLTDHVLQTILYSDDANLAEAREILEMVQKRQLYKYVDKVVWRGTDRFPFTHKQVRKQLRVASENINSANPLSESDFLVQIVNLYLGMNACKPEAGDSTEDPIGRVYFFRKSSPNECVRFKREHISKIIPSTFGEQQIRMFCKKRDEDSLELAKASFERWCEDNKIPRESEVCSVHT